MARGEWFSSKDTPLAGLKVVTRKAREDARGFFGRLYCADELRSLGIDLPIAQINQSLTTRRGSARGLHFQRPPYSDGKFVTCLRGQVFDVAVDIRRGSPTFLRWHAELLSPAHSNSLWIPPGFAHGFQTVEDNSELLYLHSVPYESIAEDGLQLSDPALGIEWPLPFVDVSPRDAKRGALDSRFEGI